MLFIPVIFGIIFFLVFTLKLLGGMISWWIVIVFGALFIIPIIIFVVLDILSRRKH